MYFSGMLQWYGGSVPLYRPRRAAEGRQPGVHTPYSTPYNTSQGVGSDNSLAHLPRSRQPRQRPRDPALRHKTYSGGGGRGPKNMTGSDTSLSRSMCCSISVYFFGDNRLLPQTVQRSKPLSGFSLLPVYPRMYLVGMMFRAVADHSDQIQTTRRAHVVPGSDRGGPKKLDLGVCRSAGTTKFPSHGLSHPHTKGGETKPSFPPGCCVWIVLARRQHWGRCITKFDIAAPLVNLFLLARPLTPLGQKVLVSL